MVEKLSVVAPSVHPLQKMEDQLRVMEKPPSVKPKIKHFMKSRIVNLLSILVLLCVMSVSSQAYMEPVAIEGECSAYLSCGDGHLFCIGTEECSASSKTKSVTCDGKTIKC